MPNFDRTGPEGKGPAGRRLGNCQASQEMINDRDSGWSRGGRSLHGRSGEGRRYRGIKGGRVNRCAQRSQH